MLMKKIKTMKNTETYAEANKILKDILKSPKDDVIPHLMEEFRIYTDECKKDIFPDNDIFAIQSMIIFTEFRAKESFDLILDYLTMSYYTLSYQMASFLVENTWEVLYILGEDRIEDLKKYANNKHIDLVVRNSFFRALVYLTYIGKESKENTLELFLQMLNDNSEYIDLQYYLTLDMRNLNMRELADIIKKVEIDYKNSNTKIEQMLEFDYVDFEEYQNNKTPLISVVETYEQHESEYFDEFHIDDEMIDLSTAHDFDKHWRDDEFYYDQEPRAVVKIGRNDPCPCGSGKKYKKCCGK